MQHINADFQEKALSLFKFQYERCRPYQEFCNYLGKTPKSINGLSDVPFLPISFFKNHKIYSSNTAHQKVFKSSGTTSSVNRSSHFIADLSIYDQSIKQGFLEFFGKEKPKLFCLLPGYLENKESSLIYMIESLKAQKLVDFKGYYLNDFDSLAQNMETALNRGERIFLWGVTFALLEFCKKYRINLQGNTVCETGGMKGRGAELIREEVHQILEKAFGLKQIASEYGMTELLSQAWSAGHGVFTPSSSMRVLVRDVYDPLSTLPYGETGGLNIIDLNNKHSCSFIATDDLGRLQPNGKFEVLGRNDNSEVRGCNLLAI